jgi:hypothetical protein
MKPLVAVQTRDTRRDITQLLNRAGEVHGIEPVELLGGALAESTLHEHAVREKQWPDVSYGLWQPAVKWLGPEVLGLTRDADGTVQDTPHNRQVARAFCWDAAQLTDYLAPRYKALRAKWGDPVEAWCRWNKPGRPGKQNPNRPKYQLGLAEAETYLESTPVDENPSAGDPTDGFVVGTGFRTFLAQHPEWGRARMDEQPMVGGAYLWTTPTTQHPKGGLLVYRAFLNEVRAVAWE